MAHTQGHTPGPWEWTRSPGDWTLWGAHGMRPIVLDVCAVRDGKPMRRQLRVRDQENCIMVAFDPKHPDARLIAAAPELLAACKLFVRDRATCPTANGRDLEAWDLIKAAIARAEGK